MTGDKDTGVRRHAAELLSRIFPEVKEVREFFLTWSSSLKVRMPSFGKELQNSLLSLLNILKINREAWDELVRLASVEDREVRKGAVLALSSGYTEVPDKGKAWKDLIRLSDHSDNFVKRVATRALGNCLFSCAG